MGLPVRIKLTNNGLLILLANHYSTGSAHVQIKYMDSRLSSLKVDESCLR